MLGLFLRRGLMGCLAGIALNYLVAMAASLLLKLGYFMPCPAFLPERVGGEMNAVMLQALLCALAGASIGIGTGLFKAGKGKGPKREKQRRSGSKGKKGIPSLQEGPDIKSLADC